VTSKRFREDLYFRLNVFPIESVPLRHRVEDIPTLAQEFLNRTCQKFNRPRLQLKNRDVTALKSYAWPGNVRELENVIERQVITSDQGLEFDLPRGDSFMADNATTTPSRHFSDELLTETQLRELEAHNVRKALTMTEGRVFGDDGAAALLGLKPTTLTSRLRKLRIDPRKFRHTTDG
ncbi:MAG: Fis family transcriptional regulator, partial [Gammaproteobacteria bacterium]